MKTNRALRIIAGILIAVGLCMVVWCALRTVRHRRGVTPDTDTGFVSTRYITGIAIAPDGTVWAGSRGGVLCHPPNGPWKKTGRFDGLPANEVREIRIQDGNVHVITPLGNATWQHGRWVRETATAVIPDGAEMPGQICSAVWEGRRYAATVAGLNVWEGGRWVALGLPPSIGTHISALLPHGNRLWAALYGDGIRAYDGRGWQPVDVGLPAQAREITALAATKTALWVGTRRAGLWERHDNRWQQHLQADEPVDHNCQAIATYRDSLYISTLEDGLAVRTPQGWGHVQTPLLSSDAPRQMVVYRDRLYVRHGDGRLDEYDGRQWRRDVCAHLPRRQASALATDGYRLYVAQWGGWSEFDGKSSWTHFLTLPALQGVPVTALLPAQGRLWIGTQGRGLAEYVRATGALRWHDERAGLPDDWITALTLYEGRLYAGTFVGGLACYPCGMRESRPSPSLRRRGLGGGYDGARWQVYPELAHENITALEADDSGPLAIATRHGVWRLTHRGAPVRLDGRDRIYDPEDQALCSVDGGLWIGTRTGLYFRHD